MLVFAWVASAFDVKPPKNHCQDWHQGINFLCFLLRVLLFQVLRFSGKVNWHGHLENRREVPQTKLKIELPYDLAIPVLGTHPKEMKTGYQKGICTLMSIAALFTITRNIHIPQDMRQPKCPSRNEWVKKMRYPLIKGHYSVMTMKEVLQVETQGWPWSPYTKVW